MDKKNKMYLGIGLVAVGGYLLYKQMTKKKPSDSTATNFRGRKRNVKGSMKEGSYGGSIPKSGSYGGVTPQTGSYGEPRPRPIPPRPRPKYPKSEGMPKDGSYGGTPKSGSYGGFIPKSGGYR